MVIDGGGVGGGEENVVGLIPIGCLAPMRRPADDLRHGCASSGEVGGHAAAEWVGDEEDDYVYDDLQSQRV